MNKNIESNLQKATELIQKQKEDIAKRKNNILIAETRREENQKSILEDEKKVKDLGVDPSKIDETIDTLKNELNTINSTILEVIDELENFDSI